MADIWLIQYFECIVIKLECQHIVGNLFWGGAVAAKQSTRGL